MFEKSLSHSVRGPSFLSVVVSAWRVTSSRIRSRLASLNGLESPWLTSGGVVSTSSPDRSFSASTVPVLPSRAVSRAVFSALNGFRSSPISSVICSRISYVGWRLE